MMDDKNIRVGISSLIFNINEALEICNKNKEINHIEIGIDNLCDCKELKKYENDIKKLDLSVGIHLPMELNPCEDIIFIKEKWIEYINILSKELEFLNVTYFNMHLGYVMTNRLSKNKEMYLNNIVDFFNKLLLEKNHLHITIENTYTKGGDFSNLGNDVEDFKYIFEHNKTISFCFDSGHNLICKSNYNLLKNKTRVIHLNDNYGIEDEHLGILKGNLSEEELKNILSLNPEFLVLEMNLIHIEESLDILKEHNVFKNKK